MDSENFSGLKRTVGKTARSLLQLLDRQMGRHSLISILCYHEIDTSHDPLSVSPQNFREQIHFLLSSGFNFLSLDDLDLYLKNKSSIHAPSIVITFDDGYQSVLEVRNFLNELNIKPTLFLLADPERANRNQLGNTKELLTRNEILTLKHDGWGFGCHSATHNDFFALTTIDLKNEIAESKQKLEDSLNSPIQYFAYPRGRYTNSTLEMVNKSGYKLGLTVDIGPITQHVNFMAIPRLMVMNAWRPVDIMERLSPSVLFCYSLFQKFKKYGSKNGIKTDYK